MKVQQLIIAMTITFGTIMLSTFAPGIVATGWSLEPIWHRAPHRMHRPDCVGAYCCDDYVAKPRPCAIGPTCFECPDYCAKPLPCARPVKAFCCDDYCLKRLPPICCVSGKDLQCVASRLPPIDVSPRLKSTKP